MPADIRAAITPPARNTPPAGTTFQQVLMRVLADYAAGTMTRAAAGATIKDLLGQVGITQNRDWYVDSWIGAMNNATLKGGANPTQAAADAIVTLIGQLGTEDPFNSGGNPFSTLLTRPVTFMPALTTPPGTTPPGTTPPGTTPPGTTPGGGVNPLLSEYQRFLSGTNEGRAAAFQGFQATNPVYQQVSPIARGLMEQQFEPLSLQFELGGLTNPRSQGVGIGSFQDYLGSSPQAYTPQEWSGQISNMLAFLPYGRKTDPTTGQPESDIAWKTRMGGLTTDQQMMVGKLTEDEDYQKQLLTQAYLSGLNPVARNYGARALGNRFAAFRQGDVTTPLLERFWDIAKQG